MAKSVAKYYAGSPSGDFDWRGEFAEVEDASISDCVASDARSDDIVFSIPFLSIVSVSIVDVRRRSMGPACAGVVLNINQSPVNQGLWQSAVGGQGRRIAQA